MTPEIKLKAKQAFADSYLFYLQAHYYHWNVEGRHFSQDHELFGKVYEEVYGEMDKFAEEIRTLGTYAPGVFDRFIDLSQIQQEARVVDAEEMYSKLIDSNAKVIEILTELFEMLEANRLHGFADFIGGRIDSHNKHQWMLKSTLK
jgi:starvation-inducible DNA-binding protein